MMSKLRKTWIAAVLAIAACGIDVSVATAGSAQDGFPAKGDPATAQKRTLRYGGETRDYLVQPAKGHGRVPVVVLLHGMMVSAEKAWTVSSLPTLAARDNFIMVAPQGINDRWRDDVDIGFIRAVIKDVIAKDHGDPKAVFMLGFSMGGHITIEFICSGGTELRAAGTASMVISSKQLAGCHQTKPLPWVEIHGDKDPLVPFNGGHFTLQPEVNLFSAADTFNYFADHAKCGKAITTSAVPDISQDDNSTAEKQVRSGCTGGATSTFYIIHNAGHSLPGGPRRPPGPGGDGVVNEDFDAGSVVWDHFKQTLKR